MAQNLKVWQDKNEHARRRAAETDEVSSGERHGDDEGSAGSEKDVQSVQRPQKRMTSSWILK